MAGIADLTDAIGYLGVGYVGGSDFLGDPTASTDALALTQTDLEGRKKTIIENYMEGTATLVPNSEYSAKQAYNVSGLGAIFDGTYYTRTVTHTINADGYSVEASLLRMEKDNALSASNIYENGGIVAPITSSPPVSASNPQYKVITLVWGDTLWALSRKYGTTVEHLASINNIPNPDLIYAGAPLKVPAI